MAKELIKWSLCAEVIGPPGAGKSTLLGALGSAGANIRPVAVHRSVRRIPLFLRSRLSLLSVIGARGRDFSSKERIWMLRVESSLGVLEREASSNGMIFDQGPLYAMLRLRAALPHTSRSLAYRSWWDNKVDLWARTFDVIILLDAPDEVLLERIRARSKHHLIEELTEERARAVLEDDRAVYDELIDELSAIREVRVLRFNTGSQSPTEIAAMTMEALGMRRV